MERLTVRDDPGLGFEDLLDEDPAGRALEVEGQIPSWLSGSLIRNGPARWQVGKDRLRHWFDGQAMLHAFSFERGSVRYSNRFLDSESRRRAEREGGLCTREFATDPCRSIFQRVHSLFSPGSSFTDNANVSVHRLGEQLIAMTETPMPVSFDRDTLATLGTAYAAPGQLTTAHPHYDRADGGLINYATHFGRRSKYRLFRVRPGAGSSELIGEVPVTDPAYMHSFGITEKHLILAEFPLVVNPVKLAISGRPFIENFKWEPERGTRFTVVSRETGTVTARLEGPAFFAFHHINAFEEGGRLFVDICASEDASAIEDLYLSRLRARFASHDPAEPRGFSAVPRATRFTLDPGSGSVESELLSDEFLELPVVDHARARERRYRRVWGVGSGSGWPDRIVALDLERGEATHWSEPGSYPGEPVFVARPDATAEGDGVLLSVVLSGSSSSLVVLDASSLEPLGRARVGHPIPYGFHGLFTSEGTPSGV